MSLTQKQFDDLASWVKSVPTYWMDEWDALDAIRPYIDQDVYERVRGELCADKDMMDAYR